MPDRSDILLTTRKKMLIYMWGGGQTCCNRVVLDINGVEPLMLAAASINRRTVLSLALNTKSSAMAAPPPGNGQWFAPRHAGMHQLHAGHQQLQGDLQRSQGNKGRLCS